MVRYSVVKVDRIGEYGDGYSAREYVFDKNLPSEVTLLLDHTGHYTSNIFCRGSKILKSKYFHKSYHVIGKYKYLIIKHEVNYEVTPETYWNELGSLEKPTITQIKCYQFIINNLI